MEFADVQKKLTGLNANPTYLVFDSKNKLEVARIAYTNSRDDYIAFLKRGLEDEPIFRSVIKYDGLTIVEGKGEEKKTIVVLESESQIDATEGVEVGKTDTGKARLGYKGAFTAKQAFRVGSDLEPGEYVVRTTLLAGVYFDGKLSEVQSKTIRIPITVVAK